jgi:RNA polymerase sigma factor (sigma-70 family)
MPLVVSTPGFTEFLVAYTSLLESLHLHSKAAHWNVSYEEFASALYRSAMHRFGTEQMPAEVENYLRTLHVEDLALACALRRGSEPAWEKFVADYRPALKAAARSIVGAGGDERAQELADSIYAELYGISPSGGIRKNSLLDYFHGRSKLRTWLRSVLAQRYVDVLRVSQRIESLDDENAKRRGANPEPANSGFESIDPDRARLLPRLVEAISEALAALPASDRLLLSLYYVQGMTLAQIACMRGFHEATASRRLQNIRLELRRMIEHSLAENSPSQAGRATTKGLSAAEIHRCLDYMQEEWSFDLTSTLAGSPARVKGDAT